jgi:hypothetical protein
MDIRKLLAEHSKIEHRTLHRRVFYDGHNISVPSKDILVSCYFQTRWQEEYAKLKVNTGGTAAPPLWHLFVNV